MRIWSPGAVWDSVLYHFYRRAKGANKKFWIFFARFWLKYGVYIASAEGAREKFRVFCRTAAYDVIFINSREGQVPTSPLRASMSTGFDDLWSPSYCQAACYVVHTLTNDSIYSQLCSHCTAYGVWGRFGGCKHPEIALFNMVVNRKNYYISQG